MLKHAFKRSHYPGALPGRVSDLRYYPFSFFLIDRLSVKITLHLLPNILKSISQNITAAVVDRSRKLNCIQICFLSIILLECIDGMYFGYRKSKKK